MKKSLKRSTRASVGRTFNYPTIYRCSGLRKLQMIAADEADSDESPFSEVPDEFPRKRLVFKAIPPDIENLILICQLLDDWLRRIHRKLLADYLGARSPRHADLEFRRSQIGGRPASLQGDRELNCPYDKCPTHAWGHPLMRKRHYYHMPSEIEAALYGDWADRVSIDGDVGDHCLVEFSISCDVASDSDVLRIAVAPNGREFVDRVVATFRNAHVGRIQQPSLDHEFNYLPWYIAGFHSAEIGDGQWSFQLNCHNFRIQWSSDWPGVQRGR